MLLIEIVGVALTIAKFLDPLLPVWLASPANEALAVAVPMLTLFT